MNRFDFHEQGQYPAREVDGRPQGAPPRVRPTPVPTINGQKRHRGIVGTGVGWTWGGAPCGRPSSDSRVWNVSFLLVILLLSLLLTACINTTSSNAPNPYHLLTPGVLTVGSDTTNPPLEYADPTTHTTWGFDVDLITALAQRLGLKVELITSKYETLINELADGRYDVVISGMSITPDRQQQANFIPYLNAGESLMVQAGNPAHITGLANLCGMAVGVQAGTIEDIDLHAASSVCSESGKPAIAITSLRDEDAVVQLLAQRQVVATFQDSPVTDYYIEQHPGQFAVGGSLIKADLDGIAVFKDNTSLFNALQTAFHAMQADGSYRGLIEKWGMTSGAIARRVMARGILATTRTAISNNFVTEALL